MKMRKRMLAMLLAVILTLGMPLQVLADTDAAAPQVVSTEMTLEQAKSNVQSYYSNEEWEEYYPEGFYAVEHSTYEIAEGGTDPKDPEDVYLGILVYRIGGNSNGAKVTFTLTCQLGDHELYPDSVGTVEFLPQQTTATVKVKIKNDDRRTGNQMLTLTLTEATSGVISPMSSAAIKVFDDEPFTPSVVSLSVEEAVTDRSEGGVKVALYRAGNVGEMCSVHVTTADGTAVAGTDYEPVDRDVVFLPGQDTVEVVIPLVGEERHVQARSLSLELTDLRGCVAEPATAIRLDITNAQDEPAKELTNVDDAQADLSSGEGDALVGGTDSVINVNDTIDRTELLKTAIGTVSGTAVQSFVPMTLAEAAPQDGKWTSTLEIPNTDFVYRWSTAGTWTPGSVFSNGNEDLLLTTKYTYDLNLFDRITVRIRNLDGMDVLGNPNTAFGYLPEGGWTDKDGKFYFIKSDLTAQDPDIAWMDDKDMYILMNRNNSNIDYVSRPVTLPLFGADGRYTKTYGIDGAKQKLFIIAYDDEGWDDTNFYFETTSLHRTVIPFTVFKSPDMENVQIHVDSTDPNKSTVTFDQEGFRWTIALGSKGGVGKHPDTGAYGFYVGSLLKITCSVLGQGGSNVPIPQYLYLVDSNGAVHNSAAMAGDNSFTIPLETLLTTNTTKLVQDHYLSEDEAVVHVKDTMGKGSTINSELSRTLGFRVRYRLMQGIELDFGSIPHLVTRKTFADGTMESDAEWEARVLRELGSAVTFYRDGKVSTPEYKLYENVLVYALCEFDYIQVDPRLVGPNYRISSDLYDMDYQDFGESMKIGYDECAQLRENVTFRIYDPAAAYLVPGISIQSTGVSELVDGQFRSLYTAMAMDRYIPFETLYSDTSAEPGVRYYTVRFTISDIYVGTMEGAVKKFRVNIGYEAPKISAQAPVLSFWFKGGASFAEASDVGMFGLNSKFRQNTGVADAYMPVLELEDRTAAGYSYVLHIPTYYNYQNADDKNYDYYEQLFFGGDGIFIELEDYDRGDGARMPVIADLGIDRTQSVMTKMPDVGVTSDEQEMSNHYFEEQNEFYTYNDHKVSMSGFKLGVDPGAVLTAILKGFTMLGHQFDGQEQKALKRFTGTTPLYVQFGNEQVIVGGRLTVNGYGTDQKPGGTPEDQRPLLSDVEGLGDMTMGANGAAEKSPMQKANSGKVPSVYGSLDARFVFTYDRLNMQYDFSSFAVTGALGLSFMVTAPIPPAPVFYVSFSTKLGVTISTGTTLVKDYIDGNGKAHYKATWNGLAITPNVNFTLGLAVGISGIIAGEFGGSVDLTFAGVLGKQIYKPAQYEFDLDTVLAAKAPEDTGLPAYDQALLKSARMTFSPGWKTYIGKQDDGTNTGEYGDKKAGTIFYHSYGKTLCRSETSGDTITIVTAAASVQLLGVKEPEGGKVKITVSDMSGGLLGEKEVDLSATQTQLHQRIFTWERDGFDNMKTEAVPVRITIQNISEGEGKQVTLDSIRIHNLSYKLDESSLALLSNATLKLALYIKVTILGINISLEPGYMQINYTASSLDNNVTESATLTMGSFYYSKTYELMTLRQDEGLPVVMASRKLQASTADPDYFTTGQFAAQRSKTLLVGDIENTAKNQVIGHGGDVYAFYTVTGQQEDGNSGYYQLCWSKNGVAQGRVTEDIFVADFRAYIDGAGDLALVMTASDGSVASVAPGAEQGVDMGLTDGPQIQIRSSDDLYLALQRTCVKTVTFDHVSGTFRAVRTVGTTDGNGLQESLPVAPEGGKGLVFYVEDTKTDVPAKHDMNWTGFNEATASSGAVMSAVMDSMYRGRASVYYALDGVSHEVGFEGIPESYLKPGFKITSMDAALLDASTVMLAYSVEVPYAQQDGRVGTLKQIHYRKGTVGADAVTFGPTVVVASVFDHDDDPGVVFAGATEVDPVYHDGGDFYEQIILRNVQFERAVVEKGAQVRPVLFYQTNKDITYVTYDALEQKTQTGVLYDGDFESYVLAVDENGAMTLVYSDNTESGSFVDTLYLAQYDGTTGLWNKPRQLTVSDAFDAEAFADREDTAAVIFDGYSAFVYTKTEIRDGVQMQVPKVAVSLKSSYVPFNFEDYATDETVLQSQQDVDFSKEYDKLVVDEDGNVRESITVPVLDYESRNARTDLFMITFEEPVTRLEVRDLELSNTRFLPGEEIRAYFDVVNMGDAAVNGMTVSLAYYDPGNGTLENVVSQKLTGALLSGDSYPMALSYTVPQTRIADGTVLVIAIRDASGRRSLYQSYLDAGEAKQYHEIHDRAEFYFRDNSMEVSSDGTMEYTLEVGNKGLLDADRDVDVYVDLYEYQEDLGDYRRTGTLFSMTVAKDRLASGSVARIQGRMDVSALLDDTGKLCYGLRIVSGQAQYDADNDEQAVLIAQQIPEVALGIDAAQPGLRSTGQILAGRRTIRSLKLGGEVVLDAKVVSDFKDAYDIEVFEVGSNCLSVDRTSEPGKIKIKVVAMPPDGVGNIKLKVRIGDTVLDKSVYLQVTNSDVEDLDGRHAGDGWTLTDESFSYALEHDMITTATHGAELRLTFRGEDMKLYGDRLTDGGDLLITVRDSQGTEVVSQTVTTGAEFADRGMLLYATGDLPLDTYEVTIRAVLDEGERIALDHVTFRADVSGADVTPYPVVRSTNEVLDAPLLSGRSRDARFTVLFDRQVALAEGKTLEEMTLRFNEYEDTGDGFVATGDQVTFVATELLADRVIFTTKLSSTPGAVLKYVLSDETLPAGFLVAAKDGAAVQTQIPGHTGVSYVLKESGISSVTVVEDTTMPAGSVQKSVRVKFLAEPDLSRLEGTKLLYMTKDLSGQEQQIPFGFCGMTDDPRVAIYRAEALELEREEIGKIFAFQKGIVLNENEYVLVTAEGDYLENDVTTVLEDTSQLDITYEKLKATTAPWIGIRDGRPTVYVSFPEAVDHEGEVYVMLRQRTLKDGREEITTLRADLTGMADERTVMFQAEPVDLPDHAVITYSLISGAIVCEGDGGVIRVYDGILTDPALKEAQLLELDTDLRIDSSRVYLEGGMKPSGTVLKVDLTFRVPLEEASLAGTTVEVIEQASTATLETSTVLTLAYETMRVVDGTTVVTYACAGDVSFAKEELTKRFRVGQRVDVPEGTVITTADGRQVLSTDIAQRDTLEVARAAARTAELELVPRKEGGYRVAMRLTFPKEVRAKVLQNIMATVTMERPEATEQLGMALERCEDGTLYFLSDLPLSLYADEAVTFRTPEQFFDPFGSVVDSALIGVDTRVPTAELTVDKTGQGTVEEAGLSLERGSQTRLVVRVRYGEILLEKSFRRSTLPVTAQIRYADGQTVPVEKELTFQRLEGRHTAVYAVAVDLPGDMASVTLELGDVIRTYGDGHLFNVGQTLKLSKVLPRTDRVTVETMAAQSVQIRTDRTDGTVRDLSDTRILVEYPAPVIVTALKGLTLKVQVRGIEGVDTVTYQAVAHRSGRVVELRPVDVPRTGYGDTVELVLSGAVLILAEGTSVEDRDGLPVSTAVPDATQSFRVRRSAGPVWDHIGQAVEAAVTLMRKVFDWFLGGMFGK